jgi:hypothetical protein
MFKTLFDMILNFSGGVICIFGHLNSKGNNQAIGKHAWINAESNQLRRFKIRSGSKEAFV